MPTRTVPAETDGSYTPATSRWLITGQRGVRRMCVFLPALPAIFPVVGRQDTDAGTLSGGGSVGGGQVDLRMPPVSSTP